MGRAFSGAMCGSRSVGVSQDGGRSLTSVVTTAAHELGHIFNMSHYDEISESTLLLFSQIVRKLLNEVCLN